MSEREKVRRLPLWLTKILGILYISGSLLAAMMALRSFVHDKVEGIVYGSIFFVVFFAYGLILLFAKKGAPMTWHDRALLLQQAREEPDGLDEALPPEEQLKHLEIMLEQGVLSQEEYDQKRQEILTGL